MKKFYLFIVLLTFLMTSQAQDYQQMIAKGTYTVQEIQTAAEAYFDRVGRERGNGYKPYKRWEAMALLLMDDNGLLKSPDFYYNVLKDYNAYRNSNSDFQAKTTVGTWEDLGPTYWEAAPNGYSPGVGRISALDVETGNANHMIIGSPTGGIWRSTNGGLDWTVLTDNLSNLRVWALAIDPLTPSTYYWGSRSGIIFKSTDSGSTWSVLADIGQGNVNKIIIDPTNTNNLFCSSEGGGIFKSSDAGSTWNLIHPNATNGYDVEFKPGDTNIVYASGNSVFVSNNGGTTFVDFGTNFGNGPKMIGVAEQASNSADQAVVYVLEATDGNFGQAFEAIYKSTNSGQTFVSTNIQGKNYLGYDFDGEDDGGQAPRDMDIVVSSSNTEHIIVGGINSWNSINSGESFQISSHWFLPTANFQNVGYCHADIDVMKYVDGVLYAGTDGGFFKAINDTGISGNFWTDLSEGLSNRQFYRIGVSQTSPVVIVGGSQDNGSCVLRTDGLWYNWWGADGGESLVDKNDPNTIYGCTQFGSFVGSDDAGQTLFGVTPPDGKGGQNNWNFFSTPFEQDPIADNTVYVAFDEVYKSLDGGFSWTSISQNFAANIDALKIAPSNNQFLYLSINNNFWKSTNGGQVWTQSFAYPGGNIASIAVHPTNENKVAVTSNDNQKVYVTNNAGATWTPYRFDLPNFAPLTVIWDDNPDNGLYLGMNYGVYYTDDTIEDSWIPFNNNLPNVIIFELDINYVENKIYAGTHGRGLWVSDTFDSTLSTQDFDLDQISLYPNPARDEVTIQWTNSNSSTIRIFNMLGKLVYYNKNVDLTNGLKLNTSNFESGVYFVKTNTVNGEITKKLILR